MKRDAVQLYRRHWAAAGEPWGRVLLVHGIGEHLGRYERTASILSGAGLDVHGFDLRGHGRTTGPRMYVERWSDFLDDVETETAALRAAVPGAGLPLILFGHSMGALIALTYACSERPKPDLLVLSAPPLDASIPAWQRFSAPILGRVAPRLVVSNPIDGAQLARDPSVGERYFADPLVQPASTARLGAEMLAAMKRARGDLARLDIPTLVIHGGDDPLVPTRVSEPLARVAGVERRVLPGLRHETLNEPEGPEIVGEIVAWLRAKVAQVAARHDARAGAGTAAPEVHLPL